MINRGNSCRDFLCVEANKPGLFNKLLELIILLYNNNSQGMQTQIIIRIE